MITAWPGQYAASDPRQTGALPGPGPLRPPPRAMSCWA